MLRCWYYLIFFRFGKMKHDDSSCQLWSGPLMDGIMLLWCLGRETNPKSQKSSTGMRIPYKENKILRIYDVGNADTRKSHVNMKESQDPRNLSFSRAEVSFRCSVIEPCPTLCDAMDWIMPGFPVLYYLLEFAQTHAHWVSDARNVLAESTLIYTLSALPLGLTLKILVTVLGALE